MGEVEKQTVEAALQNGLGLAHVCKGLHKHPREVSDYMNVHPDFKEACQQRIVSGYQQILMSLNDSVTKKNWGKWRNQRDLLELFIMELHTWESECNAEEFSFIKFTFTLHKCKTLLETAMAMGLEEIQLLEKIYEDQKIVGWLMQNGYKI
jgi:hypothetical protein